MLDIVVQLVDFLWKAIVEYGRTPEGQAEFQDIVQAVNQAKASGTSLFGDADETAGDTDRPAARRTAKGEIYRPSSAGLNNQPRTE